MAGLGWKPLPHLSLLHEVIRFSVPLPNVLTRIQQMISFQDEGGKLKHSESIKHFHLTIKMS